MSKAEISTTSKKNDDGIDLPRIAGLLLAKKWLIVAMTLGFIILGGVYSLLASPIYRADMLVQIEQPARINPLSDVNTLLGKQPPSQAEIEIVRSRTVLGGAVDTLQLDLQVKPSTYPIIGGFLNRMGVSRPSFAENWRFVWAEEFITVTQMDVSKAYEKKEFLLRVIDENAYDLSLDGERLGSGKKGRASSFLDGEIAITVASVNAPKNSVFYITRLPRLLAIGNLKKNLSVSEKGQDTGVLSWSLTADDPQSAAVALRTIGEIYVAQNIRHRSEETRQSLDFLEQQLPKVREELARAEDLLNAYRIDKDSLDLPLETRSVLDRLVTLEFQINELDLAEAEISQRFTPTHPTYAALLDKKQQLKTDQAKIEAKIESLPETQQQILRLQRDAAVNQQIYVQLRNKVQEMQIAEASTVGNVRIIDKAEGFPKPVHPVKKMILVYAAIFGMMCSVSWVMFIGLMRKGMAAQEDIEALGLSVFATVPLSKEIKNRSKKRKNSVAEVNSLLASNYSADSAIEALRALRTSLYFSLNYAPNKYLMVTSATPEAGKSFISMNLAAVCAQAGQRVLLVDGDMRRGSVHKYFGAEAGDGLSDALLGKPVKALIRSVGDIENLDYLSRGSMLPNPSEQLARPQFSELLKSVEQNYDLIIIDTPPVLVVTDAAVIGRQAGTVFLVVRFDGNTSTEVSIASSRLQRGGVQITGVILNGLEASAAEAYGHGLYGYNYEETVANG